MSADWQQYLTQFHADEDVDARKFQPRARLLQSLWRDEQGFEAATSEGKTRGARLPMPWAKRTLANFLTPEIREVVRAEVLDSRPDDGKLFAEPRIFDNLLSSQPLCFNLFAPLKRDLELASAFIEEITEGRMVRVHAIEFEYSPGRSSERYTDDRSAFDVFMKTETAEHEPAFIGIEVKYHENMKSAAAKHRPAYDATANKMDCFRDDARPALRESPLQQLWRDHLLVGSMLAADDYADGFFAFLYPSENEYCREAALAYRYCLNEQETFRAWTLERVVKTLASRTPDAWVELVRDRYLGFEKLETLSNSYL